jgi:hypothetical protein
MAVDLVGSGGVRGRAYRGRPIGVEGDITRQNQGGSLLDTAVALRQGRLGFLRNRGNRGAILGTQAKQFGDDGVKVQVAGGGLVW